MMVSKTIHRSSNLLGRAPLYIGGKFTLLPFLLLISSYWKDRSFWAAFMRLPRFVKVKVGFRFFHFAFASLVKTHYSHKANFNVFEREERRWTHGKYYKTR